MTEDLTPVPLSGIDSYFGEIDPIHYVHSRRRDGALKNRVRAHAAPFDAAPWRNI